MEVGNKIKVMIVFFVFAIIGLIFLTIINQNVENQASLGSVKNDSFTADNSSCVQVTSGCISSLSQVVNTSTILGTGNYTLCRSSTGNKDGIVLDSGEYDAVTLNATYSQSADCSYVSNSTARNLSTILVLLFVIALVVVGIAYFKELGWDFMGKE